MTRLAVVISLLAILWPAVANCAQTIVSGPAETTELWEGKALTAQFRVGMCYAPNGKARGVLILRHRNGQEDIYHLYGTMQDGQFSLSHSSGHTFKGELTGPNSMAGKAKLKNGMSLSLKGKRQKNVRLLAKDCAPL